MLEPSASQSMAVLLVEDNPDDEHLIRRLLKQTASVRVQITAVRSYADAADALMQPFDVCFMDYDLGEYTAIDLLARLAVNELSGPVILLTGHEDFSIDQAALDLGVADFITKSHLSAPLLDRALRYGRRQFEDQQRLSYLANHDQLTGLLNRHAFLNKLNGWLERSAFEQNAIYLLYIDLDGFKAINDNWGHDIGDKALCHVAEQLADVLRTSDLIARYGGDEIIAAVSQVDRGSIERFAEKVLAAIRKPFINGEEEIIVTASIGIAGAGQAPDEPMEMLRLADHAMFAAKRSGRDGYRVYTSDVPLLPRTRASLEADLRRALAEDALHMVYQPQFDLQTRQVTGAEALARWRHPEHGDISPGSFIPVAEETGLIRELTRWSLRTAIAALQTWAPNLPPGFRLSVNLSPVQLLDPKFADQLANLLNESADVTRWLRLEITESFFLHETAATQLQALQRTDASLALDDFGTGYSSLSQLAKLPIDTLKIDLAFVAQINNDPRVAALTQAIISMAQALKMNVIAEGVETEDQASRLLELGCRYAQGWLFAAGETRPVFSRRLGLREDIDQNSDANSNHPGPPAA